MREAAPKKPTSSKVACLLAALFVLFATPACDKLGFKAESKSGATSSFAGVKSISITPDGKYVLVWDLATGSADISSTNYEVYMDKWPAMPAGITATPTNLIDGEQGVTLGARLAVLEDSVAPVKAGVLLHSIRGERSYTLDETLQPHVIYAFQVRLVNPDGSRDSNQQVLIYSADLNTINFAGVTGLEVSPTGKTQLSWDPPTDLPAGINVQDVTYEIYMDSTSKTVEEVAAQAVPSMDAIAGRGLTLAAEVKGIGTLADLPDEQLPAATNAPLAERKGGRYLELQTPLTPGKTYVFQVLALGPGQELGANKRVIIYHLENMAFDGLVAENVKVSADGSKISLSWKPATGNKGVVSYVVYSDANFATAIATTDKTTYDFEKPVKGQTYTFAVRAFDGDLADENRKFVIVSVPDPSDKTPPEFDGLMSATAISDKKILLKWNASTSTDIGKYYVYSSQNLTQSIGSTASDSFVASSTSGASQLAPATEYSFIVRARDASDNEDRNTVSKSATTLSYSVPDFAGLGSVSRLSGVDGLSKLNLSWGLAGSTATGYYVFKANAAGDFDFSSPLFTIGTRATTSQIVSGLAANTLYKFIVRAFDSSSGSPLSEENQVVKSSSTLAIVAPTFAGAASALPGPGSLAFTTARVTWPAPQTDGVFDGFVVQYEIGSCAAGFSGSPAELLLSGDALRDGTVTGLSPLKTYRMRVLTNYSPTSLRDKNSSCKEIYTSPEAPTFAGIASLTRAIGVSGFTQATATWTPASGSFSYYRLEWATNAQFTGATTVTPNILTVATSSKIISNLPPNTTVYVRVTAVFDDSGVKLENGANSVLSVITTPVTPTGEGLSAITIMASDSLKVAWDAPSNATSALYSNYKVWQYCGASAATNINARVTSVPAGDYTYSSGVLDATYTGLAANTECCYQVRAYYSDGTYNLGSTSNRTPLCKTPTLVPPSFAGVGSVTNNNLGTGFTQLEVTWPTVNVSEDSLFSYYEIDWATSPSGQDWLQTMQISTRASTSASITGLSPNTKYYVRVRAVNNTGTPSVNSGADAVLSATTTPKSPTGDSLSAAASISSTKLRLTYTSPNPSSSVGGLFNNVFLYIQAGNTSAVTSARSAIEAGGVTGTEIQGSLAGGKYTLTSLPALVRVPPAEFVTSGNNSFELWGLTANTQVCIQALATYWVDGLPANYLPSLSPSTKCATPTAAAPTFAGVASVLGFNDSRDFSQLVVNWPAIVGDCTSVQISAKTSAFAPDWGTPTATAACGDVTATLGGLSANQTYFVQVRAVNDVSGTVYASGAGVELSKKTTPTRASGDATTGLTITSNFKTTDSGFVTWTNPTSGSWNRVMIFKGTGATAAAAEAAVRASATSVADLSATVGTPIATITNAATLSYTDNSLLAGVHVCYMAMGAYVGASKYILSDNSTVKCGKPAYTPVSFDGAASTAIVGTWPDGTAKIEITFASVPGGSVEQYLFSHCADTCQLMDAIDRGDPTYDPDPNDDKIFYGGRGKTVSGTYALLVNTKFFAGPSGDTFDSNNSQIPITVAPSQANLAYVSRSFSNLSYDYFIYQYEASNDVAITVGSSSITTNEADVQRCAYEHQVNRVAFHSSCGTTTRDGKVGSVAGRIPTLWEGWDNAFVQCRKNTDDFLAVRLPTEEEFLRAGQWVGTSYSTMMNTYQGVTGSDCNVNAAFPQVTGARANCKNGLGIYDMAGNVPEFVDSRMVRHSIANAGTSRFGYSPNLGRTLRNGIDNLTRIFHEVDPGPTNLLWLAMGAGHYQDAGGQTGAYGPDVHRWINSSYPNAVGFRCVLLGKQFGMPQLALPQEPSYTSADSSGAAGEQRIPENLYIGDTKPESVNHYLENHPGGGTLYAWPFNANSSGAELNLGVGGTTNLSITGTLGSAAGPDGKIHSNVFGAGGASKAEFINTDANTTTFTTGGWFYRAPGSVGDTLLMAESNLGTYSYAGGDQFWGFHFAGTYGGTNFVSYNGAGSLEFGNAVPHYVAGWHHFLVTEDGSELRYYIDGEYKTGAAPVYTPTSFTSGKITFASGGDTRVAMLFYHKGVSYSAAQVKKLYSNQVQNDYYGPLHSVGYLAGYNVAAMRLTPWTKTFCTPNCTTVDVTGYDIFRFREPTRQSNVLTTPWIISGGTSNPYSVDAPLDPLAVDASSAALYSPFYSTTTCASNNLAACSLLFSESRVGGDDRRLWNYQVVAKDTLYGNSTRMPARSQRFRSIYYTGSPTTEIASAFRMEPRLRKLASFLVDEPYQLTQSIQQVMAYVPMDKSGLDHDFFIQKYEASLAAGSVTNGTLSSTWPLQSDGAGGYLSNVAKCYEDLKRTGAFSVADCGDGAVVNATTAITQSKPGTYPLVDIDQGAFWKACANTGVADIDGGTYSFGLPSDSEWLKAADWGDLNHDGTIDVGINAGLTVASVEQGPADATTIRCHSDNNPSSTILSTGTTDTANCRSRYGAADMVGNVIEFTGSQIYNGIGSDNGLDGTWYNRTVPSTSHYLSSYGGRYDLLRGFPMTSGTMLLTSNGDYFYVNPTGQRASSRGGGMGAAAEGGRYWQVLNSDPSVEYWYLGGRCRR